MPPVTPSGPLSLILSVLTTLLLCWLFLAVLRHRGRKKTSLLHRRRGMLVTPPALGTRKQPVLVVNSTGQAQGVDRRFRVANRENGGTHQWVSPKVVGLRLLQDLGDTPAVLVASGNGSGWQVWAGPQLTIFTSDNNNMQSADDDGLMMSGGWGAPHHTLRVTGVHPRRSTPTPEGNKQQGIRQQQHGGLLPVPIPIHISTSQLLQLLDCSAAPTGLH